ncbi:hypothetical protein DFH05DRAFT_1460002 [Lentinula detonsa]|uniref:Uncharacterized protein n=1 Tax=Lentinula detonsa TaxID=2804962 RepID=A0A9W8TYJ2_9AGAR|nr:hypothetical protein DFH05DRAFT_1460002 [Lentinula detonsa]
MSSAASMPPQHLIDKLNLLHTLLTHLPASLPLSPASSSYHFVLSNDNIEDRGVFGAVSRCLEICFGQRRDGIITFTERGPRTESLVSMLKEALTKMSQGDCDAFEDAWLNRLIEGAQNSGARLPKRKQIESAETGKLPALKKLKTAVADIDADNENLSVHHASQEIMHTTLPKPLTRSSLFQPPKLKQSTLFFTKDTRTEEEKHAAMLHQMKKAEEAQKEVEAQAEQKRVKKLDKKRKQGREHQQRYRNRRKGLVESDSNSDGSSESEEPAQTSQRAVSDLAAWRDLRNGTQGGETKLEAKRVNWFHPLLWPAINQAMRRAGWSSQGAVDILQRERPELYSSLHRGTIHRWKKEGENDWSERTWAKIMNRHALVASGRAGALTKFPDLISEIKSALEGLRTSGLVVNVQIARSIMLSLIQKNHPEILTSQFRCTESYVRTFFQSVMDWTPRVGTRAAIHLPSDADDLCERAFFQLAYCMKWENIPAKLVINFDQQGIFLLPSASKTYHKKGDRQVDVVAKDEKRAFTLCVASTAAGDFLPFQCVWAGKTDGSLPSRNAPGMSEALENGFHFTVAASEKSPRSHFSTLKTMKEWIREILVPYRKKVIDEDPGLSDDQKAVLYIDVYPLRDLLKHTSLCKPKKVVIWSKRLGQNQQRRNTIFWRSVLQAEILTRP